MEVRYPPPSKGVSQRYLRGIPCENKANGCDTPLCDTISKGYCAIWGGISHWAAKIIRSKPCRDHDKIRRGRTWAIAVRRGSCKSLFLPKSGRFSLENIRKFSSELQFA